MMSAFKEHCSEVVKEYVQTVLIIDDMAGLSSSLDNSEVLDIPEVVDPLLPQPTALVHVAEPSNNDTGSSHQLNALELTNAFYEKGIIAGLYQPVIVDGEDVNEFASKVEKVAAAADILILDWVLKDNDSRYSQYIIKKIIELDRSSGGRMRSIIVYTGERDLNQLKDGLLAFLDDSSLNAKDSYQISSDNLLISFYNKSDSGGDVTRETNEADLPDVALKEFSVLVNGLIPAFAMKSAAVIRQNTGRIINRFNHQLDTGYLAHRTLLPNHEDAEVFMLENFISYLRNLLAINKVDKLTLNQEMVLNWIDNNHEQLTKTFNYKNNDYTCSKEQIKKLLKNGFSMNAKDTLIEVLSTEKKALDVISSKKNTLNLIQILNKIKDGISIEDSSKILSILTSFRRSFDDLISSVELPYLTQGSIIYDITNNDFLVCVTPKCDTARVESSRLFSFSKLTRLSKTQEFDLILPIPESIEDQINSDFNTNKEELISSVDYDVYSTDLDISLTNSSNHKELMKSLSKIDNYFDDKRIFVKTEVSFYDLIHIEFEGSTVNRVMPIRNSDGLIEFSAKNVEKKYIWIGDLEDLDIQKRVSNLVGNLNRIGTDEVEWLRRQYQK
ncbi:hypothetical protein GNP81_13395 [Aliivibrio fischeri]|uniref:response regulator receiver domain n=1 Tax=Aliivibrio fischeri TaxID=668 RepID=UPI0012D950CC|nr:response regulator receiver domain [Aliivibrio fischeri]MUK61532.1 hypothetical protein [Aliivibrio fischeri]MUL22197.1 hypothetical protein [Aliivibrio fischeri]MUL25588.1 hypothetical protein [Aliivibrio fischeri]